MLLILAACAEPDATPTTAGSTTADPPSTVASPSTTSSAAPPSTAPTTTEAGGWAEVPVVASAWGVMGWWDGSTWVAAADHPDVELAATYQMLTLGRAVTEEAISVGEYCGVESGGVVPRPDLAWGEPPFPDPAVAVSAGWETRVPIDRLDAPSPVHLQAVSEFLSSRGLEVDVPELAQVIVVDLQGDGAADEVVIVAEKIAQAPALFASPGDYAVTLVLIEEEGETRTEVLDEWVLVDLDPDEVPFIVSSRVAAVPDLDGDGAGEIALVSAYYEGSGIQIYDYTPGAGLEAVLGVGCGV